MMMNPYPQDAQMLKHRPKLTIIISRRRDGLGRLIQQMEEFVRIVSATGERIVSGAELVARVDCLEGWRFETANALVAVADREEHAEDRTA